MMIKGEGLSSLNNDDNEIVFFKGLELVNINEVYFECLMEAKEKYLENLIVFII